MKDRESDNESVGWEFAARWRRREITMETHLAMEVAFASAFNGDSKAPGSSGRTSEHLTVPTQSTLTATTAVSTAEPDELVLEAVPPPTPSPDEGSNENTLNTEDSPQNVERLRVSLPSGRQGTDT